jgi:predicted house-cleaning noncanonical NTP pyrophosphatase (MazG superfamily)
MEKVQYNKLVRDGIPDELTSLGKAFETRVLDDVEYERELLKKVVEEAEELRQAPDHHSSVKELADIFEVIDAVVDLKGISRDDIEAMRESRREKRGGFLKKIFLLWSEDDGYEARKKKMP